MAARQTIHDYDVIIVGAGISGINFAYRLQEKCPDLSYCILEGRHEIGGTWSLFKYPGIRSDSDLYTFGFSWRPWNEQSSIAEGPRIIKYMKESAAMYGIDKKIHFHHKVDKANWSSSERNWTLDVTANKTEKKTYRGKFFMLCTGYYDYNEPLKTVIPGLDQFQGKVMHPQFWDTEYDYSNQNVVIIGSGATAITLLPNIAPKAKQVTILQRSPSYVLSQPKQDGIERLIRGMFWWSKPVEHKLIRWKWLLLPFLLSQFSYKFPLRARKLFSGIIDKQLPSHVSRDPHFNPSYNPFEQRVCLCPDGDFYQALREGKGSIETGVIDTVTPNSIKLLNGKELHPDMIVTATGLKVRFAGGVNVSVDGNPYPFADKFIWKGQMLEDLPNAAFVVGYVDASWTLGADATAQMICRILNQMKREGVDEVIPRRTEEEKKSMTEEPLLKLQSTYVKKAKDALPKAGSSGQWRARSYYYKDIMMAWFGDIKGGMEWRHAPSYSASAS
ncbi:monooxygenase [Hortaea werneckii]|uniref:FAD/NAD(P)-binding domain-containing protein n=1 Tax=Hortaea werneckii TaxID=91943 RepID=A0A3M6ZVB1_HORWE|nr:monooxygenase [Hortaea werneckii]KAI6965475.1 monooxygenase [Hortaea werneckii]KAI7657266.1 monooxygenase [Hortaea werneckii]RMY19087.1 hypothetical protein D0867_04890 [Hortaea werneckii]RMY34042.1 hypothetical protein D0866_05523 [Hortaea werneckii]